MKSRSSPLSVSLLWNNYGESQRIPISAGFQSIAPRSSRAPQGYPPSCGTRRTSVRFAFVVRKRDGAPVWGVGGLSKRCEFDASQMRPRSGDICSHLVTFLMPLDAELRGSRHLLVIEVFLKTAHPCVLALVSPYGVPSAPMRVATGVPFSLSGC